MTRYGGHLPRYNSSVLQSMLSSDVHDSDNALADLPTSRQKEQSKSQMKESVKHVPARGKKVDQHETGGLSVAR